MKIGTVLVSANENPEYYRFFPYIKPIWERLLKARCILIYIGSVIPKELEPLRKDIVLFPPIPGIHTAFLAQNVRLLYPAILDSTHECIASDEGILIADVDSIPMSRDYFLKQVESIENDKFVNYSFDPAVFSVKEHNISFCLALPVVWKEIFNIERVEDISNRLSEWNKLNGHYHFDQHYRSKCVGFHFDQQILYRYLEDWKKSERGNGRLFLFQLADRIRFLPKDIKVIKNPEIQNKIKAGFYQDNIFLRPYEKKKLVNSVIARLLLSGFPN